jgi:hypothetical protein
LVERAAGDGGGIEALQAVLAEASFWEITAPLVFLGCWMAIGCSPISGGRRAAR